MNIQTFSQALGAVDQRFLTEALQFSKPARKYRWISCFAAACLFVILAAGIMLLRQAEPSETLPPDSSETAIQPDKAETADGPDKGSNTGGESFRIDLDAVYINEISALTADAARCYDPALCNTVVWDEAAIESYFGTTLSPSYIPEGLFPAAGNDSACEIQDKTGNLIEDCVTRSYYHAYYEDGSPMPTQEAAAYKGFTLRASKIGLIHCCLYLLPDEELGITWFGENEVVIGYRAMPYGPYDPQTHLPSGYYDFYLAQFMLGGVEYEITSYQLSLSEFLKIVASTISGRPDVEIFRQE